MLGLDDLRFLGRLVSAYWRGVLLWLGYVALFFYCMAKVLGV